MKKLTIIILTFVTALTITGCSPKPEVNDGNIRSTQTENIDAPEDVSAK